MTTSFKLTLHVVCLAAIIIFVASGVFGAQFCATDGNDQPNVTDPMFICNGDNFTHLQPPLQTYNKSEDYNVHYCSVVFLLDLDRTLTSEQNYSQIVQFISASMSTCMDRGVGYKVLAYPMFNTTAKYDKTTCCDESGCYEFFGFMNYVNYVGVYDSFDPVQNETPRSNFSYVLINDLKLLGSTNTKCLYNNFVLITNRLFNVTNPTVINEINNIYVNGCITLTVVVVGNPDIDYKMAADTYKGIIPNVYVVPGFNCLDNLQDCIRPCGYVKPEICQQREFTDCAAPTDRPTTVTSTTPPPPTDDPTFAADWHIFYLFAVSNRTSKDQFDSLVKFVSDPLRDCQGQNVIVRFLARNNSDSGWITDMSKVYDYMTTLTYDEVMLQTDGVLDVYDSVTLQLVQEALAIPVHIDPSVNETRITLLTDFVSKNLTDAYNTTSLWRDLELYDFQIIAFSQEAADMYQKMLTVKPKNIHADPGYGDSHELPVCPKSDHSSGPSVTTIMFIIIGTCAGAMTLLVLATILYRQKYMWMEKLNRFKTNHESDLADVDVIDYWELSWDKLVVKNERLGHGAYGQVFRGKMRGVPPAIEQFCRSEAALFTDCDCAVKMLPKYASDGARQEFRHEIELMKSLGYNEHIVNMLGCITASPKSCLVLEYCSNRDLLRYVKQKKVELELSKSIDDTIDGHKEFLNFGWQIAQGMRFLGEKKIIHRDLAARNILITGLQGMKSAKVSDFGLAISAESVGLASCAGRLPIKWLALECLEREEFSTKSDVWSFGMVIFEMYSMGEVPFGDVEPTELIPHLRAGERPKRPLLAIDKIADVMNRCWDENPAARPEFDELGKLFASQLEQAAEGYGYLALIRTQDYRVVADLHIDMQKEVKETANGVQTTKIVVEEEHVHICIDDNPPYASRKRAITVKSNASVRLFEREVSVQKSLSNSASRKGLVLFEDQNGSDLSVPVADNVSYTSRASKIKQRRKSQLNSLKPQNLIPSLNALNPFAKDGKMKTLKKKFSTRRGSVPY